jgi:hypothetical protein
MTTEATPNVDFAALKRRSRLPAPPVEASDNLAAPEAAPATPQPTVQAAEAASAPASVMRDEGGEEALLYERPRGRVVTPYIRPPAIDAIDGRSRLRTGRTEPFSTRVRAEFRPLLVRLADRLNCTMAEAMERALEEMAKRHGIK